MSSDGYSDALDTHDYLSLISLDCAFTQRQGHGDCVESSDLHEPFLMGSLPPPPSLPFQLYDGSFVASDLRRSTRVVSAVSLVSREVFNNVAFKESFRTSGTLALRRVDVCWYDAGAAPSVTSVDERLSTDESQEPHLCMAEDIYFAAK